MVTREEYIARELMPIAGDYADDFDWDAICDEASDFDPTEGYVTKPEIKEELECVGCSDTLNELMRRHARH